MDDIEKRVAEISQALAPLSIENQLLILQKVQHEVVERSEGSVSSAKLNSGAKPELFACMAMQDLTWNGGDNNGTDAVNAAQQGVELKTFAYVLSKPGNAHITFPPRPKDLSNDEYRAQVRRHFETSPKYAGGLRIVAMTKSKSVTHHWYILPQNMLSKIADAHLLKYPDAKEFNPNGVPCSKCKLIHRMLQMQLAAERGDVMISSPDKICRPLPPGQLAENASLPEIHLHTVRDGKTLTFVIA